MVKTASTMMPLGTKAPDFSLLNVDGHTVSLSDFEGVPALLVIFMCNHCPFVKHLADALATFAPRVPGERRGGGRHQLERCQFLSSRFTRTNGDRGQATRLYFSVPL